MWRIVETAKPISFKFSDVNKAPEGESWIRLTALRLASMAWRARSVNAMRLLEFLELEHMNHGGKENGRLKAPYAQLVDFGISRRLINPAITEAEALGLLRVERGQLRGRQMRADSLYRLTYLPFSQQDRATGSTVWCSPTDEWKRYTPPKI